MTAPSAARGTARHLVLVGLPGAGKSTVGALVAAALGRPFVDLDAVLERRAGRTVAEQFAAEGEAAFRAAEAALSAELAAREPAVIAPGGGWMTNAAARGALAPAARTVYLRVRPATAAARLADGGPLRPLLAGAREPVRAVAELLVRRGPAYEGADAAVDADADGPAAVADAVVRLVRAWEDDALAADAPAPRDPHAAILHELEERFGPSPSGRAVEIYLAARGYDAGQTAAVLARVGAPTSADGSAPADGPTGSADRAGPAQPWAPPLRVWGPHERARFTPEAWGQLLRLRADGLGDQEFEHFVDRALLQLDGPVTLAELRALLGDAIGPGDPGPATVH